MLVNFCQNNKRGGCNKRGGWQKPPKLINGEVGINGEAGKNTAIRNFIEIKSSSDLVKISTKRTKNTKVVYLHEESLVLLLDHPLHATSCFIVIRKQFCAMWKKQHAPQTVMWLCLGLTLPLSTVHMKRGVWNKRGGWQNSPKLVNGECWIRLGRVEKNGIPAKNSVF